MQTLSNILDYKHAQWLLRSIDSILSSSFLCDSGFWIYDPCSFPRFCLYAFIACIEHAYEFFPWNRKLPCIPWDLSHNTGWLHQNLFIKTSLIVEFCKTKTSETVDRDARLKIRVVWKHAILITATVHCSYYSRLHHSDRALGLLLTVATRRPCRVRLGWKRPCISMYHYDLPYGRNHWVWKGSVDIRNLPINLRIFVGQ